MLITIDNFSGFCWGVVRTVQIAERSLIENKGNVFVLGNIIHNPMEIARLEAKGLRTITHDEIDKLPTGGKVLIRAHGEPPETYRRAFAANVEIIDATCPVVTKLQERVRKFYEAGFQVVIFGKKDHAEMLGLRGVCEDNCIVIKNTDEALTTVNFALPTVLFSQTTMDKAGYASLRGFFEQRIKELVIEVRTENNESFFAKDTICGQVSGREAHLARFASENDIMIFVAGKASSNGKVLYEVCKAANPRTYFIEKIDELQEEWFGGADTVGISGATSTPHWYMGQVKEFIEHDILANMTIHQ